jgi:hypothetical protein
MSRVSAALTGQMPVVLRDRAVGTGKCVREAKAPGIVARSHEASSGIIIIRHVTLGRRHFDDLRGHHEKAVEPVGVEGLD